MKPTREQAGNIAFNQNFLQVPQAKRPGACVDMDE
jgi:hypothetical protein